MLTYIHSSMGISAQQNILYFLIFPFAKNHIITAAACIAPIPANNDHNFSQDLTDNTSILHVYIFLHVQIFCCSNVHIVFMAHCCNRFQCSVYYQLGLADDQRSWSKYNKNELHIRICIRFPNRDQLARSTLIYTLPFQRSENQRLSYCNSLRNNLRLGLRSLG